jgi:tRNA ligase
VKVNNSVSLSCNEIVKGFHKEMHRDHQPQTVPELISQLEQASQKTGKGKAQKRIFKILNSDKNIVSWKFNEWDYAKEKIKLPSDARGLFTLENEERLAVRGYDKFFNINEVAQTKWNWLENNTEGPYQVTLKENGCIILVSGLEDGTLVVCSKHSTGSREDINRNHAAAGQKFLEAQLGKLGIEVKDFALTLYERNLTVVAEYCDDYFEEHIVEYKGEMVGLYLHGLNLNKPVFETLPFEKVQEFAEAFGFQKIDFFQIQDIVELRKVLEECSKTGSYNGNEAEGFVIRCKLNDESKNDYFFKFKFEEPYLMFRQWREVTRDYIQHRRRGDIKFTKHRFITNNYLDFVIPLLENDNELAEKFLQGFGIIDLRKRFLEDYGKSGPEILNQELLEELDAVNALGNLKIDKETKYVFVPIATIGCGKTTTAMTLTHLYPHDWDIVINDDIPNSKNSKKELIKRSLKILQSKKAVIIDRNNHQFRERKQIFDDFMELRDDYISHNTNVQFICLNFIKEDLSTDELWKLTTQRVLERGDNHQSIKAATEGEAKVKGIMKGFVNRFQPVETSKEPDSKFDLIIDLNVDQENSSFYNAEEIIKQLHSKYPVLINSIPSQEMLQASFSKALEFKPVFTKTFPNSRSAKTKGSQEHKKQAVSRETPNKKPKRRSPVYFSIDLNGIERLLFQIDDLLNNKNHYGDCLLSSLRENDRVQSEFHITLAHVNQGKKGTNSERAIWEEYIEYYESKGKGSELGVLASIRLKRLIWNDKALAVLVESVDYVEKDNGKSLNFSIANKFPHITIGTASDDIKPFYSNELAEISSQYVEEGVYPDVTVLNFAEVFLVDLPLKANF